MARHELAGDWGLGDAAAAFVVGFVLQGVAIGIVLAQQGGDEVEVTLQLVVASALGLWLGLAGLTVRASVRKGTGSLATDFGLRARWRDIGVGLGLGTLVQLVVVPLLYLPLSQFVDVDRLDEPAREITDTARGGGMVLLGLVLVVGAPVVEELFFRGLLLRSLARRLGPRWAIPLSALAFGLAHFQVLQFPALFVFGLVLGALAWRHGRLGPSIFAHMAFNTITFVALVVR